MIIGFYINTNGRFTYASKPNWNRTETEPNCTFRFRQTFHIWTESADENL